MRTLASRIEAELKDQEFCAVYNSDLAQVWPATIALEKRKEQIERFAEKNRLSVTFYDVGLCAIFQKKGQSSDGRKSGASSRLALPKSRKRRRRGLNHKHLTI